MSGNQEVTYALDFGAGKHSRRENKSFLSKGHPPESEPARHTIPRVARLMALAIRFEGLLHEETIRDYAELARLGRVTRARITQIMKLLHLAPDIQEQILFLPLIPGFTERTLRPIVSRIDWDEQRRMFQTIMEHLDGEPANRLEMRTFVRCKESSFPIRGAIGPCGPCRNAEYP